MDNYIFNTFKCLTNNHTMKNLLLFLLLIPMVSFGQIKGAELCSKLGDARSFNSNDNSIQLLERILSVANLKTNRFVIMNCENIPNAMAIVYEGFRYILYNNEWMKKNTRWTKMAVLAHEVGHHINGHTLSGYSLEESRKVELEADDWAGYAMAKLGASLSQTLEISKKFPTDDDTFSTHPNRSKRVASLKKGWSKGKENVNLKPPQRYVPTNTTISAAEDFNRGLKKDLSGDYYGLISDMSMAIELAPQNHKAYAFRGQGKFRLKDYKGGISDYNKSLSINPLQANIYWIRAYAIFFEKDFYGTISDIKRAMEVFSNNKTPSMIELLFFEDLYEKYYSGYILMGKAKSNLNDYNGAITDFNIALKINPQSGEAYFERGKVRGLTRDFSGFCNDIRIAFSKGYSEANKFINDCN